MRTKTYAAAIILVALVASCGDDPADPGPVEDTSFSRLVGGPGQESAADVVATSDGRRIVIGNFADTLRVTGSANWLVPFGSHDMFLATFAEDGTPGPLHSLGGDGFESAMAMSRDSDDDVFIGGYYVGPSSIGVFGLPVHGGSDAFVAKINTASGAATWLMHGGSAGTDAVTDIRSGNDGTVYFCGSAAGEFSIAGEDVGTLSGPSAFLVHVTPQGSAGESQVIDGAGAPQCTGIAVSGDVVYVCGTYTDASIAIDGSSLDNDGGIDGFVARFDETFAGDGVIQIGGTGDVALEAIATLGNRPVIAGSFFGTVDFDVSGSGGEVTSVSSDLDAFVACYNTDLSLRWLKVFASNGGEIVNDLAPTSGGGILVGGIFDDEITFASTTFETRGGVDQFVVFLDAAGNARSPFRIGGAGNDLNVRVAAAGSRAIVAGVIDEEAQFPNGNVRTTFGQGDAFVFQR